MDREHADSGFGHGYGGEPSNDQGQHTDQARNTRQRVDAPAPESNSSNIGTIAGKPFHSFTDLCC